MKIKLPTAKGATKPKRPCLVSSCPEKVSGTYCEKHQHLSSSGFRNKKETDPFYLSRRWRQTTTAYRKAHPLCEKCERQGKITPAAVTDHMKDWKDGGSKYDWNNLEALCHSCHNSKTARTNKG